MSESANSTDENRTKFTAAFGNKPNETNRIKLGEKKCKLESTCETDSVKYDDGNFYSSESLCSDIRIKRDFPNTVFGLEDFNSLEQKTRRHSVAPSLDLRINAERCDRNDSVFCCIDSTPKLRDDSADSRLRNLERETGTSLTCLAALASSNSKCDEGTFGSSCFHSVGVFRAHSEGHPKNRKRSRLKSKSCDYLPLKKNCESGLECQPTVPEVINSREIDKKNKKNRLFSSSASNNSTKQDDSKKKRKFIIILKGVLNCKKKKKLGKIKESEKTKNQFPAEEKFPFIFNYDRSPLVKRKYSVSSGNLCDNSNRNNKKDFVYDTLKQSSLTVYEDSSVSSAIELRGVEHADKNYRKCCSSSKKNAVVTSSLNRSSESLCVEITASGSRVPEWTEDTPLDKVLPDKAHSTHEFLTLLYHESLLQRFVDTPDRCSLTELPKTGGCQSTQETAPLPISGIPVSSDQSNLNKKLQVEEDEFDYSSVSDDEGSNENNYFKEFSKTSTSSSDCLSSVSDRFITANNNLKTNSYNVLYKSLSLRSLLEVDNDVNSCVEINDNDIEIKHLDVENNFINELDVYSINHNKSHDNYEGLTNVVDNNRFPTESNYPDQLLSEELIVDNFLAQKEETLPNGNNNSVINSDNYKEESDEEIYDESSDSSNEISDDETSDSSVDYDVTPIDDKYFDLHYDPYYYHGSYSLDDIPVDQPIDYPSPYVVPNVNSAYIDSHSENWWQQFDGKPGRELYRSQSQPKDLGSHRDDEPLDGNLPLHLFLSASQPLGKKASPIIRSRSNSLESLSSRRRSEIGSLCSSYGSQLYTITEELETDEVFEEHYSNKFNSCINFGKENYVDYEYAPETSNSCENFRVSKSSEQVSRSLSHPCGDLININEIKETQVLSYPDEFFFLYKENEPSEMKGECNANIPLSENCPDPNVRDKPSRNKYFDPLLKKDLKENIEISDNYLINKPMNSNMSRVCKENGVSSSAFFNMPINKGLSRSSPNIAVDCESTFDRELMDSNYFPTPTKRHNGIKEIHTYQNIPANSKALESPYEKINCNVVSHAVDNFCLQNSNGRLSEKISDDSNDSDYESNFNSDKYSIMHPEVDHHSLSSSEEYFPTSKSLSEAMSNSMTSGNFSLNLNCDFSFEDKVNPPSCFTSGVPSFSAYSSDTSLDFDTFSKSSKVFKWNGSSSISDLTSLSKEFDKKIVPSRGASSASDLRSIPSSEMPSDCNLGRTSYMQWSAQVKDDFENDDDELTLPMNLKSTSSFVFTPHAQAKRNSHMSFYCGRPSEAFHSDEDNEEGDSEEFSNSSGSDSAEDDGMMRSYHIGSSHSSFNLGMSENTGLATIAEDVEEDSGGESSSDHWLFSADNTDTDSVIHVPPPFTLPSTLPIQFENDISHHFSSEETLVASEDEVVIISDTNVKNDEIWKNMKKASDRNAKKSDKREQSKLFNEDLVQMVDNTKTDVKINSEDVLDRNILPKTISSEGLKNGNQKKQLSNENIFSFDTSNIKLVNSLPPNSIPPFRKINGTFESVSEKEFEQKPFSLMTNKVFENQIDDIFDFSSLDTCEEVSLSSYIPEASINNKENCSIAMEEDSVIFNTSATSEPFSSKKGKQVTEVRLPIANELEQVTTAIEMESGNEKIINSCKEEEKTRKVELTTPNDDDYKKSQHGVSECVLSSYKESNSENSQKIDTLLLSEDNLNCDTYLDNIISKTLSVNDIPNRFSHSSSDEEMKSEADGHFTDLHVIQNSESPKNTISSLKEMETNGEVLNTVLTNGENINDTSKLVSSINGKGKQKRCHRQNPRLRARNVLRHLETSDGDTDDTDGDFEDDAQVIKNGKCKMKIINSKSLISNKEIEKAESENSAQLHIASSFKEVPPSRALGRDLRISASANLCGGDIPPIVTEGSELKEHNANLPRNCDLFAANQLKEVNHNRGLLRPLSLGDLRYYSSDSETEDETSVKDHRTTSAKYIGVQPPFPRRQISSPSNSIATTPYNLEEKIMFDKPSTHSNGPHRPRRHQSLYSPTSKQPIIENGVKINNGFSYLRNVARPKPLSLDMAEEFLTQEGLKSPVHKYNPYVEKIKENSTRKSIQSCIITDDSSSNNDILPFIKNEKGNNINIMRREAHITITSTPDLTDESPWLSAQKQPRHQLLPALPRYSGEPQLPLSSQASNAVLWPAASVNTPQSAPHSDDSSRLQRNKHILPMRAQVKEVNALPDPNLNMCERVNRNMKTFGANDEGEVYFEKNLNEQSPTKRTPEEVHSKHAGSRGVRFSPSVEEVPITYMETDDSDYLFTQMEEKKVTKVKVVSSESPPMQKLTPKVTSFYSPPRDTQLIVKNSAEVNKTDNNIKFQNKMNSDVKSVQNKENILNTFGNGNSSELSETPSLHRVPTPESPRSPTPIWQRLKLVKIGSPKGPRPKIPPKPPSLSPRSSDGETPRASSCSSPESELSSPSSPEFKFKKIPTSPRFFSWGSKREKKEKDKNNKNSERNSHPKEASIPLPQNSASLASSSPSPIVDYPQVKRKETQVEGSYIINNCKERDETDDASAIKGKLSTSLQSNYNANDSELKNNSVKSRIFNGFHQKENENDFLKTRESILKQIKSARPTLNKVTKVEPTNSLNTSASPSTPSLSLSSDSDSILDDISSTHSDAKPPLPPSLQNRGGAQNLSKTRAHNVRRQYLTPNKQSTTESPDRDINGNAQIKERIENTKEFAQPQLNSTILSPTIDCAYRNRGKSASERLKERFERFSKATRAERERLARSTPDLSQIEESVRRLQPRIDWSGSGRSNPSPHSGSDGDTTGLSSVVREEVRSNHRSSLRGGEAPYRNTFSRASVEFDRLSLRSRTRSVGLLETDLDTGASREVLSPQETNLDDLYHDLQNFLETLPQVPLLSSAPKEKTRAKSQSLRHLDAAYDPPQIMESNLTASRAEDSRAKSMEFLLDDNNRAAAQAPENELMKEGERKVSEAELRVRRSLQRLDVPEWMKTANTQQGFLLRRRDHTMGASSGGWSAFSSKTGSMSSLGSTKIITPITPTKVVIPTRMSTRSYGGITSPSSTASISPSPSDKGSLFTYPLSRWSTSRINSGTTTPTGSFSSQRTASYTRQPYLGWRSNTSLTSLGGSQSSLTTSYLSPAERLALTILPNQSSQISSPKSNVVTIDTSVTSEGSPNQKLERAQAADVHSSIKEVTSAIVHYCTETASPRLSPRASPNPSNRASSPRRRVWVESSFVGSRPITSPETPTSTPTPLTPPPINGHQEEMVVDTRPSHLTGEYLMAW